MAGIALAIVAVLVHLTGGATLLHLGLGAFGRISAGTWLEPRWRRAARRPGGRRGRYAAPGRLWRNRDLWRNTEVGPQVQSDSVITTGKTIRGAGYYDRLVALLTLGRGRALRKRTIALARIAPGEDVLDVGCGTGKITTRAKARTGPNGSADGIDPAPEMIAVARQKAARAGLDIDYRVAAVEALPFAAATFDVVMSSLMMHHLPEGLKPHALAEIRRVLKPGGRLVVVDFKRPTSRLGRLAPVWLLHRSVAADNLQALPAMLHRGRLRRRRGRGTRGSAILAVCRPAWAGGVASSPSA